jgi:hypothetical protein
MNEGESLIFGHLSELGDWGHHGGHVACWDGGIALLISRKVYMYWQSMTCEDVAVVRLANERYAHGLAKMYSDIVKRHYITTVWEHGRGGARKVAKLCSGIVEIMRQGITIAAMRKIMHMLGDRKSGRNYYHASESDTDFDMAVNQGWVTRQPVAPGMLCYSATQKTMNVLVS